MAVQLSTAKRDKAPRHDAHTAVAVSVCMATESTMKRGRLIVLPGQYPGRKFAKLLRAILLVSCAMCLLAQELTPACRPEPLPSNYQHPLSAIIPGGGADVKYEYFFIYQGSTKADAEASCKQLGATLATIHSITQNTKLYDAMISFFKEQQTEPPEIANCTDPCYLYDEGPTKNRCTKDCDCDGSRTCSRFGYCGGADARPQGLGCSLDGKQTAWLGVTVSKNETTNTGYTVTPDLEGLSIPWSRLYGDDPNDYMTKSPACVHFGDYFEASGTFGTMYLKAGGWGDTPCSANHSIPLCMRLNGCLDKSPSPSPPPSSPSPMTPPPPNKTPSTSTTEGPDSNKNKRLAIIIGVAVGASALIISAVLVYIFFRSRKRLNEMHSADEGKYVGPAGLPVSMTSAVAGAGAGGVSGVVHGRSSSSDESQTKDGVIDVGTDQSKSNLSKQQQQQLVANRKFGGGNEGSRTAAGGSRYTDGGKGKQFVSSNANQRPDSSAVGLVGHSSGAPAFSGVQFSSPGAGMGGTTGTAGHNPGITTDVMLGAGLAVPAVTACLALGAEIIAAGDRVVANQVRCQRITRRIARLEPVLKRLEGALARGEVSLEDAQPLLDQIRAVMLDCQSVIQKWSSKTLAQGSAIIFLKAMLVSGDFEREFLDLNSRLNDAFNDLGLLLHVTRALEVTAGPPAAERTQVHDDTVKDLQALAQQLAANSSMWASLAPHEKQALADTYKKRGFDLEALLDQLRMQARQQCMDARMADLTIKWEDIDCTELIGRGGFGEVYQATWQRKQVAVKRLQTTLRTPRLEAALKRETYIMAQLRHPNVALCYGMVLQPDALALVMAYYPRGTVLQLLQDDVRDLTWQEKANLTLDTAEGMAYLHNRPFEPIIHGDLKASNLLIDSDGRVVITDFGLSRIQTITASIRTMTHDSAMSVIYAAPELISNPNQRKTQASDVYAFGMLLYEIVTRNPPFQHAQPSTVVPFVAQGGRPDVPVGVPDSLKELMVACWAHAPAARPAFGEIVAVLRQLAA